MRRSSISNCYEAVLVLVLVLVLVQVQAQLLVEL